MITEKYKFIIIDDHPLTRDGVKNFVGSHERFEFIGEFSDTRAVLNSNFSGKPDVIILDLNIPGLDGEKSCPLLKRKFPGCKVIAFTQYENRQKELLKLGFDGYFVKSEKYPLIDALLTVMEGGKYFNKPGTAMIPDPLQPDKMDDYLKTKKLTPREREVAKYMIQEFSNREIGEKIFISEATVETHRKHIKEKLNAASKRELYAMLRKMEGE